MVEPQVAATSPSPLDGIPVHLTANEVAQLLRCSRATVDRLARTDTSFPAPIKFGKALVRYRRDEVIAFLDKKHTREPVEVRTRKPARAKAKRKAK